MLSAQNKNDLIEVHSEKREGDLIEVHSEKREGITAHLPELPG